MLTSCQRMFLAILKWQVTLHGNWHFQQKLMESFEVYSNGWKKESAVRKTSKMQDTLFRWLNMSNNTLPSAWLPIDASAAGVSVFASEQWITPPKKQNPFDRRWVHHEQLTSLQQNLSLQCWIMKKQPLWQVQWLQLPAWDNCKSFQTRPESCGSLSVSPWEHQVQQSEISTLNCWQWFTMSQFNHICLTFSKPKPKLQPRSNVTVWCLGSSRSLLRRFCLCLPEGTSTFQRDRMTTMDSLKNTKAYTWEKWIPSLFSSVAVCGSFALVST